MQRNINKEIRHYQEGVFMGLSLRQVICCVVAIGVAIGLYLLLQPCVSQETLSWLCIVGAAPIAAAGFFQHDGMNFEQFLLVVLESEILAQKQRVWRAENALESHKIKSKSKEENKK